MERRRRRKMERPGRRRGKVEVKITRDQFHQWRRRRRIR